MSLQIGLLILIVESFPNKYMYTRKSMEDTAWQYKLKRFLEYIF